MKDMNQTELIDLVLYVLKLKLDGEKLDDHIFLPLAPLTSEGFNPASYNATHVATSLLETGQFLKNKLLDTPNAN